MQEVIPGLNKKIRRVNDFPKKGIIFWDITTLFRDPDGLKKVIDKLIEHYKGMDIDCIASIESRGFIIGSAVAYLLGVGFVLIRKKGKLPYDTIEESYEKEYGADAVEMHTDAVKKGDKVVLIDDLLSTGSTTKAAIDLIERSGGEIVECSYVTEFMEFGAQEKLKGYKIYSLIKCKETE